MRFHPCTTYEPNTFVEATAITIPGQTFDALVDYVRGADLFNALGHSIHDVLKGPGASFGKVKLLATTDHHWFVLVKDFGIVGLIDEKPLLTPVTATLIQLESIIGLTPIVNKEPAP